VPCTVRRNRSRVSTTGSALLALGFLASSTAHAHTQAPCAAADAPIDVAQFVPIGGIEQWITIRGDRCDNPVILFLHGGPGNTLSPYAETIYGAWEKSFTLVQWDQRGAGKTFGRNPSQAESALTVERMAADGLEVAQHVATRLGQKKVILTGGSWGSILGIHMIRSNPALFHAYLGSAQVVGSRANLASSYAAVLALARAAQDPKTVAALEALGPPPWENPRNFGILRRAVRAYEAKVTDPPPGSWWAPAAEYATPQAQADYEAGEEYSFIQFAGMKGDGLFSTVDLPALGREFDVPLFIVHGAEDLLALVDDARRYFDSLEAPRKEFVSVPRAGHDPNQAYVDAQFAVLAEKILPLTR
jgi:pimeloyl-ACP methyl ester carboxylesterase